jgi:RHS repeat-associated protein
MSYSYNEELQVLKIIEENGYYSYGMKHEAYNTVLNRYKAVVSETKVELKEQPSGGQVALNNNVNQYRFNGQEWQSEFELNVTAMDFRQYSNDIGRFVCIDPVTHFDQSPYQFGNGNPMYWADPSGLDGITITIDWNSIPDNSTTNIDFLYSWEDIDNATGDVYGFGPDGSESLSQVTINSGDSRSYNGAIIQNHVYATADAYQGQRDRFFSKQVDELQDYFGAIGIIDPTGIVDGLNSLGYLARGQKANAAIAALGIVPYLGDAAKGVKYTKSTMAIGREMHAAYKIGEEGRKEFRLISGKRIDFLDIKNGTIFELKPFNPRAMKAGEKQLNTYLKEITSPEMLAKYPEFNGIQWKTVLDKY